MQETWVPFLDQEDPLEKGMATHSSILVWRIPWTEEPGGLQSTGLQKSQSDTYTNIIRAVHTVASCSFFLNVFLAFFPH